tara:strand:+ start:1085 stop:1513 length:429 start_codon:yes stop_codon:yes gene_type:complete
MTTTNGDNMKNFFDLDADFDFSAVIVEEKEETIEAVPLFTLADFATWYPSQEVITYLTEAGIAKTAISGALRALLIDEDIDNTEEVLNNLFDVVLAAEDLVYYTQKTPRLDCFRPSKSSTLKGHQAALLANLIRNAVLGITA